MMVSKAFVENENAPFNLKQFHGRKIIFAGDEVARIGEGEVVAGPIKAIEPCRALKESCILAAKKSKR